MKKQTKKAEQYPPTKYINPITCKGGQSEAGVIGYGLNGLGRIVCTKRQVGSKVIVEGNKGAVEKIIEF